ncbi:glycosyltransferase family 4 protein [Hyphococcus flavus]|uniref:Glycosyltransferase family 4 protein n=1 Tax=Hyphococcus flavus TaxID=1866326 RepID=A0AAE9ZAB1_9PROT|nr:glycosyltransferase family 4 protein [Hyphococcus flavus]WDI30549.1 glycosyltransferase family 4 protein [Hyphococcus flavus]
MNNEDEKTQSHDAESYHRDLGSARCRIQELEQRIRNITKERDALRNSTSFRIGQTLMKPLAVIRQALFVRKPVEKQPVEVKPPPQKRAGTIDVLVLCHDNSKLSGAPVPAISYFREMKLRNESVRLIVLKEWEPSLDTVKPFPPAKRVIVNSIASLQWKAVRVLLESNCDNVALYLHETAWTIQKFEKQCPEGMATLRRIAARLHVLAVSKAQKEYLENLLPVRRTTIVRNITPNANLDPCQVRPSGLVDINPSIIMVGTIQARKGAKLFSEIADMAKKRGYIWRFKWVGHEIEPNLYLSPNVDWLGVCTGEALTSIYKEASLFLLSSVDDPLPLAVHEAMSYGVNVVCYRGVGTAEVIGELPSSFIFDNYTVDEAIEAIKKALATSYSGIDVFNTVKPFIDQKLFADVVNKAIGHVPSSNHDGENKIC